MQFRTLNRAKFLMKQKELGAKYLQYIAVGDELTRDDHEALNGLVLPINDPIWDSITPRTVTIVGVL